MTFSCRNSKDYNDLPLIDVEANISSFETVNLSEIAENIEYVPLETETNSAIQYINDIFITEDRFIIQEHFSCKAYSKQGEYLCSYGTQGNGPGQFQLIINTSMDENTKKVYINCIRKLLFEYSIEGNFIRQITIPKEIYDYSPYQFSVTALDDNRFCALVSNLDISGNSYRLFIFNDSNQVIEKIQDYYNDPLLKRNEEMYSRINSKDLVKGVRTIYTEGLNDTLFCLNSENELYPVYRFKFGKYKNPVELLKNVKEKGFDTEIEKHLRVDNFVESESFLFFDCWFYNYLTPSERREVKIPDLPTGFEVVGGPNNIIKSLFKRKTGELVFIKKNINLLGLKNDIDGGLPFWPIASYNEEQLVMAIQTFELKEYIASDEFKNAQPKYPVKKKALEQLADSLNYDDNPVLMIATLRK